MIRPDVILADYNLPKGVTGLEFVAQVRAKLKRPVPAIILTGDISSETQRRVTEANCVQLNKPMKPKELSQAIWRLLPPEAVRAHAPHAESSGPGAGAICVIDDDHGVCEAIRAVFEEEGWPVETFPTGEAFLETYQPGRGACLLIDASLPGMSGLDLLARLTEVGHRPPAIMITGNGDVAMAVHAIRAGAMDFIEKPIGRSELLASVERAIEQSRDASKLALWQEEAAAHIASLTPRQREIMDMVLAGHPSKNIAADLGISQRTVENHRAAIMDRTGAKSLPALARLALVATPRG